jgi:hypothetical protein
MMNWKPTLLPALLLSSILYGAAPGRAQENLICPIMTDSEIDGEETVEFEGVKVGLCCGKCGKLFLANPKYYLKAAPELLPQFKGMEAKLGLDKITLLPQKFCPIKTKSLICPESPAVDYQGVKIYFFDQRAMEKWKLDPDGNAKRAKEAGLLPQLPAGA